MIATWELYLVGIVIGFTGGCVVFRGADYYNCIKEHSRKTGVPIGKYFPGDASDDSTNGRMEPPSTQEMKNDAGKPGTSIVARETPKVDEENNSERAIVPS